MHSFTHRHKCPTDKTSSSKTGGLVIHEGWRYDLRGGVIDACLFRGQWRECRQRVIDVADLQPVGVVLDVGCGTGTLALLAKKRVGQAGRVVGIDPGAEQIAWAGRKAAWHNVSVEFQVGVIEQLPFADQSFDVVLSTLMMHHLPDSLKHRGLTEVERVLKPNGRLVVADFLHRQERQGRVVHFQAGGSRAQDLIALVREHGFEVAITEELRPRRFSAFPGAVIVCAVKNARRYL